MHILPREEAGRRFLRQILTGVIYLTVGATALSVCSYIFRYYLINSLSPDGYGVFTLVFTIAGLLVTLTEFNLNSTTTIFIAKDPSSRESRITIATVALSLLIMTFIGILVSGVLVFQAGHNLPILQIFENYFIPIWCFSILASATAVTYGISRGYKRMEYEAESKIASGLALVIGLAMVTIAWGNLSVEKAFLVLIFSQAVALFGVLAILKRGQFKEVRLFEATKRFLGRMRRVDLHNLKRVFVFSLHMSGITIAVTVISSIDKLVIPAILSTELLGFYAGAFFIASFPKLITTSVTSALQPLISEQSDDLPKAKQHFYALLKRFMLLEIAGYAALIFLAAPALSMLRPDYGWLVGVLRIMLVGSLFSDIFSLNMTLVSSIRLTRILRETTIILVIVAFIDLVLCVVLTRAYGLNGAAMATSVSYAALAIVSSVRIAKL